MNERSKEPGLVGKFAFCLVQAMRMGSREHHISVLIVSSLQLLVLFASVPVNFIREKRVQLKWL